MKGKARRQYLVRSKKLNLIGVGDRVQEAMSDLIRQARAYAKEHFEDFEMFYQYPLEDEKRKLLDRILHAKSRKEVLRLLDYEISSEVYDEEWFELWEGDKK